MPEKWNWWEYLFPYVNRWSPVIWLTGMAALGFIGFKLWGNLGLLLAAVYPIARYVDLFVLVDAEVYSREGIHGIPSWVQFTFFLVYFIFGRLPWLLICLVLYFPAKWLGLEKFIPDIEILAA